MNTNNHNKKERFAVLMSIDQRFIDAFGNPYKPIMELLETTFQGHLSHIIKTGKTYYHISFNNKISLELINEYSKSIQ
jgi:hypothetical protein